MNVDHSNMSYGEVGEDGEENVITLHSMLDGDDVAVDIGQTFAFVIIGVLSVSQAFDRDRSFFPFERLLCCVALHRLELLTATRVPHSSVLRASWVSSS